MLEAVSVDADRGFFTVIEGDLTPRISLQRALPIGDGGTLILRSPPAYASHLILSDVGGGGKCWRRLPMPASIYTSLDVRSSLRLLGHR